MSVQINAVAWYRRSDWAAIRAMSADRSGMAVNFDEWLADAVAATRSREQQGNRIVRVEIKPDELAAFARGKGLAVDGHCRSALAAVLAKQVLDGVRGECPID